MTLSLIWGVWFGYEEVVRPSGCAPQFKFAAANNAIEAVDISYSVLLDFTLVDSAAFARQHFCWLGHRVLHFGLSAADKRMITMGVALARPPDCAEPSAIAASSQTRRWPGPCR